MYVLDDLRSDLSVMKRFARRIDSSRDMIFTQGEGWPIPSRVHAHLDSPNRLDNSNSWLHANVHLSRV